MKESVTFICNQTCADQGKILMVTARTVSLHKETSVGWKSEAVRNNISGISFIKALEISERIVCYTMIQHNIHGFF